MNRLVMSIMGSLAFAGVGCADAGTDPDQTPGTTSGKDTTAETKQAVETPLHSFKLELGPEHYVLYNAYADGVLLMGESGQLGDIPYAEAHELQGKTPLEAFQELHPNEKIPAELAALQAFLDERGTTAGPDDEASSIGSGASSQPEMASAAAKDVTSDPASFRAAFGCFFGQGDVYDACVTNWTQHTAFAQASSRWAIYKMAPYLGSVLFTVSINGSARLTNTINQGGFWWQSAAGTIRLHNDGTAFSPKNYRYPDLVNQHLDLSGTGEYHFSARFHNYRVDQPTCAEVWDRDYAVHDTWYAPCTTHYN